MKAWLKWAGTRVLILAFCIHSTKEKKITVLQEQIAHNKERIKALEETLITIAPTDIIGLSVSHKAFGVGTVIEQTASSMTVNFNIGIKRFSVPSAFIDGFLSTDDPEINEKISMHQKIAKEISLVQQDISIANRSIVLLEKK